MTCDIRPWIASMDVLELKYHKRKVSIQRLLNITTTQQNVLCTLSCGNTVSTQVAGEDACAIQMNISRWLKSMVEAKKIFSFLCNILVYCNYTVLTTWLFTSHSRPQYTYTCILHLEMVLMFRFLLHLYYFIRYYHVPVSGSFC